ncbi:hypothetical protein N9L68_05020 [bacterium]|nr:hypothetical protein [bacterium]
MCLPDQKAKGRNRKRSHLNANMESVFGHRHGVWDYLHTVELLPLRLATATTPLHERVLDDEIPMNKRRRSMQQTHANDSVQHHVMRVRRSLKDNDAHPVKMHFE